MTKNIKRDRAFRVESVKLVKSLRKTTQHLEEILNEMNEEHRSINVEMTPTGDFIITGYRPSDAPAEASSGEHPLLTLLRSVEEQRKAINPDVAAWLDRLLSGFAGCSWSTILEKIPPLLPAAIRPLQAEQMKLYASEIDRHIELHLASPHLPGSQCRLHDVLRLISDALKSTAQINIS